MREQGLERMRPTEVQPDEGQLPFNDGADLDQFDSDCLAGGLCQLGPGQGQAAEGLHQGVAQSGEQQAPLVSPPAVGANPVGERASSAL